MFIVTLGSAVSSYLADWLDLLQPLQLVGEGRHGLPLPALQGHRLLQQGVRTRLEQVQAHRSARLEGKVWDEANLLLPFGNFFFAKASITVLGFKSYSCVC